MVVDNYESKLALLRESFIEKSNIQPLISKQLLPEETVVFLLVFCFYGIPMTRPVESWIKRAGEATIELGYERIGRRLAKHAKGEADHDQWYENDVASLINFLASEYDIKISREELEALDPPEGIQRYVDLHEKNIASDTPFNQIAIEYEIENLSVTMGPWLCGAAEDIFGDKAQDYLTFLYHHVELDVHHTKFNRMLLEDMINELGSDEELIATGMAAMEIYASYVAECMAIADELYRKHAKQCA